MSGRLLLLHGPAGTGKTTAIRARAQAWRSWCPLHYVIDPDRLFREPGYLLALALGKEEDDNEPEEQWRLLVLEDCGELIRPDAKTGAGQALARLFNLTDEMLGQGLNLLVAITTNEAISRLHPAAVRPGRCMAQIEVGPLSHGRRGAGPRCVSRRLPIWWHLEARSRKGAGRRFSSSMSRARTWCGCTTLPPGQWAER